MKYNHFVKERCRRREICIRLSPPLMKDNKYIIKPLRWKLTNLKLLYKKYIQIGLMIWEFTRRRLLCSKQQTYLSFVWLFLISIWNSSEHWTGTNGTSSKFIRHIINNLTILLNFFVPFQKLICKSVQMIFTHLNRQYHQMTNLPLDWMSLLKHSLKLKNSRRHFHLLRKTMKIF